MTIVLFLLEMLVAFLLMEGVTWLTHKYVMHGFLWYLHKDHHQPTGNRLEKNDSFFLIFAIPSIVCIYYGNFFGPVWLAAIGAGITLYGLAYFIFHEVIIHQRIKWFTKSNNSYIKALRWAHKMHHKHLGKEVGESFGMLWVAKKYWDKVKNDEAIQKHG